MTPEWVRTIHPTAERHYRLLRSVCRRERLTDPETAYVLATAWHETRLGLWMEDHTSGWSYEGDARLGNTEPGDGHRYRRRGYAQLVGRAAYRRWSRHLDLPLVERPALASIPEVAADILVLGLKYGRFTGHRLSQSITESRVDYVGARRAMAGGGRPITVAEMARRFEGVLGGGPRPDGLTRREALRVQHLLRAIGWPVGVDGLIGPFTRRALRDFQAGYSYADLPRDGQACALTRLALENCVRSGGQVSDHFRFQEFRTFGPADLCATNRVIRVERGLVDALERYRRLVDEPVRIACGYRSVRANQLAGARPDSEHLMGRAVHVGRPLVPVAEVMALGAFTSIGHRDGLAVHLGVSVDGHPDRPRVYPLS